MGNRNDVRRPLRPAIGALLAALCVGLAVAGCGGGSSGGSAAGEAEKAVTSTPAPGGEVNKVTWDLPTGEPTTLDYVKSGDYSPDTVVSNLCDNLLRMKPDFSAEPGLAKSWHFTNPTTLVYEIRPGVKFWDGNPLTAEDVVASLQRNMEPKQDPVNGGFFVNVKSIEATGPLQVTVNFKKPDELFNKEMSTVAGAVAEASYMKEQGSKYGTPEGGVMCTGPFKLKTWASGSHITLERNADYWDKNLLPKVRELEFKFISNSATLTSALQSGAIEGSYEIPAGSASALKTGGSGKLYKGKSLQVVLIGPTHPGGPLANPKLVEALNLSINREGLAKNVFQGYATPIRTIVPPTVWEGSPQEAIFKAGYEELPTLEEDLPKAEKLMKEVPPVTKPLILTLQAGDQAELQIATFVQAAAKEIGVPITLRQLQPTQYANLFYVQSAREGVDMNLAFGWVDVPDGLDYAPLLVQPDGIFNWTGYDNPTVNRELEKARSSLDEKESAEAFVNAQKIYTEESETMPLLNRDELLYMSNGITGAPASFAYIFSPWAASLGKAE